MPAEAESCKYMFPLSPFAVKFKVLTSTGIEFPLLNPALIVIFTPFAVTEPISMFSIIPGAETGLVEIGGSDEAVLAGGVVLAGFVEVGLVAGEHPISPMIMASKPIVQTL